MYHLWKLGLLLSIVSYNVLSVISQEVETKTGKLKGASVDTPNGKKVNKYIGVPYAEPPVGPLRFKPPATKKPWADVLDVTGAKEPPLCVQINADNFGAQAKGFDPKKQLEGVKITGGAIALGFEYEGKKDSEDCLVLNIYAPAEATPDSKLGVMYWIHGGAFYAGGTQIPSYDGSVLASEGNVVVVTVQYRLGVYGFLHAATKEIPGNMGLRDMVEGLKWCKDNIAVFGGDPEKITVFGSNSGGWSAGFMMMSPFAKPYFARAIMQSGSALSPLMLFGEAAAIGRFSKFVKAAECPIGPKGEAKDSVEQPTPETYECLAKLTKEQVDGAQAKVLASKKDAGYLPSEDGTLKDECFFCKNPFDFVKDDKFEQKDCMMGTNSNEGGMMLSSGLYDIYPPFKGDPKPVNLNDLVEHAKKNGAGANAGKKRRNTRRYQLKVCVNNQVRCK